MLLQLAWRNLFRQRRRTLLTMLTMWGGFVLSSFSIAWSDGTYNRVIEAFTRTRLGHIQIHREGYSSRPSINRAFSAEPELSGVLDSLPEVTAWTSRLLAAALVAVESKTTAAAVLGIDPERENRATSLERRLVEGRLPAPGESREALADQGLARRLAAGLGSEVVVVSQAADGSIANEAYRLVGLVDGSGNAGSGNTLYLTLADAQALFVLASQVHEVVIIVDQLKDVPAVTEVLRRRLEGRGLEIAPWQEFARLFYVAMEADRKGTWITLGIILLIMAIGVLNTVLMNLLERTREYGVMRAIGTRPGFLWRLVVLETVLMALVAVAGGAGVAAVLNWGLSKRGVPMPTPFTYGGMEFSHFYTELNLHSFYVPMLTVVLTAACVSALPAWRAARIAPARALHAA
jgi:ABC-type lipoprotein release transport system permease subunit